MNVAANVTNVDVRCVGRITSVGNSGITINLVVVSLDWLGASLSNYIWFTKVGRGAGSCAVGGSDLAALNSPTNVTNITQDNTVVIVGG